MSEYDVPEECPHCDEAPPSRKLDAHIAKAHRDLPPCTAFIETEYRETYRCSFRAGHSKERGKYGAWHASKNGTPAGRYVWNDSAAGAVPHQPPPEPTDAEALAKLKRTGVVSHTVVAGGFPEWPIRVACAVLHTDAHGNVAPCPGYPHADSGAGSPEPPAPRTASLSAYTGLVVQPYRNDQGRPAWVFRCWGTDDCDGWLSLDHASAQSAACALTRHVEECHTPGLPQPEVKIRIREGLTEQQRAEVQRLIVEELKRARREARMNR